MIDYKTLQNTLQQLENDENKLYSFLYNLVYKELAPKNVLKLIYEKYLNDLRSEIRSVSIYSLLFALGDKSAAYRKFAIDALINPEEDFKLRNNCATGLGEAFSKTNDLELIKLLIKIFHNIEDDENVRTSCFNSAMKIYGLNSKEILERNGKLLISVDDIDLRKFPEMENLK